MGRPRGTDYNKIAERCEELEGRLELIEEYMMRVLQLISEARPFLRSITNRQLEKQTSNKKPSQG